MTSGAAREHVRVARALRDLPVIRAGFGAGRLSYAKVRALTRIATAENEQGLAELAGPMTGNQLERFARAHRQVTSADDAGARVRRRLAWRLEEDGSLAGTFRLPPLAGAVLLKALRAAAGMRTPPRRPPAETFPRKRTGRQPAAVPATSSSLADALCWRSPRRSWPGEFAAADDPEVYQVVVHVGTDALTAAAATAAAGVSAETRQHAPRIPGEKQRQRDQADDPEIFRPRKWVVEPADWIRYLQEHTAA